MSCHQLISALPDVQTCEIDFESKKYQIEVELLENTDSYVHVGIAVDNGHFWRAMRPLSSSFIAKGLPGCNEKHSFLGIFLRAAGQHQCLCRGFERGL
jgi:hypothetical protein